YESAATPVPAIADPNRLSAADPSIRLSYDQVDKLQWLAYRGVLTDERKAALAAIDSSATLVSLVGGVQGQGMPAYRELMGAVLAIFTQGQTYVSTIAVPAANAIDPKIFAAYPQMQFNYDATAQTETLAFQGILTEAEGTALAALLPGSTVLASLLQD